LYRLRRWGSESRQGSVSIWESSCRRYFWASTRLDAGNGHRDYEGATRRASETRNACWEWPPFNLNRCF
jgi:hypothetical protein